MSDVTKKFITFILIMLIAIAAIIGCVYVVIKTDSNNEHEGSSNVGNAIELSAAEINKQVIKKMDYKGISELASGDISSHLDIPEDSVTQASIYISDSSASAMEIACFKLTDPNEQSELINAISAHIALKQKGFQDSPKEREYIENYALVTYNGYVFLAISENSDHAAKAFEDILEH
ncbi:MAG: DUF4358 domain-containing protein [Acutalibacteraceae bacterium]|nr:DUF4358 domain-containing protein [Acutalibacteraceae bacterium]